MHVEELEQTDEIRYDKRCDENLYISGEKKKKITNAKIKEEKRYQKGCHAKVNSFSSHLSFFLSIK